MSVLNIVLIEPQIPQNTGNIARTCAATGARLHLVGPLGFEITDAKLKRAGLDYWRLLDITTYESTPEFFSRNPRGEFYYFTTKARRTYTDIAYPDDAYLVFGREDAGLPEELLQGRREALEDCTARLAQGLRGRLLGEQKRLAVLSGTLDALSPLRVLSRGYAMVTKKGHVLKSAGEAAPGDKVAIRLAEGELSAEILEKGE